MTDVPVAGPGFLFNYFNVELVYVSDTMVTIDFGLPDWNSGIGTPIL
ncbi:MAG: hypothetical protein ACLQU1_14835 [Bryobacteraceae bacterium]